jgi:hypothetical protein
MRQVLPYGTTRTRRHQVMKRLDYGCITVQQRRNQPLIKSAKMNTASLRQRARLYHIAVFQLNTYMAAACSSSGSRTVPGAGWATSKLSKDTASRGRQEDDMLNDYYPQMPEEPMSDREADLPLGQQQYLHIPAHAQPVRSWIDEHMLGIVILIVCSFLQSLAMRQTP